MPEWHISLSLDSSAVKVKFWWKSVFIIIFLVVIFNPFNLSCWSHLILMCRITGATITDIHKILAYSANGTKIRMQIAVNAYWRLWQRLLGVLKIYFSFLSIKSPGFQLIVAQNKDNIFQHPSWISEWPLENHSVQNDKMESPWILNTVECLSTPGLTPVHFLDIEEKQTSIF